LRYPDGSIKSGTQSFKVGKYDGAGMRYLKFSRWLETTAVGVDRIAYEAMRRHIGTDAAHVYGGLMATLTAFCEEVSVPYEGVPVGTIKKHATGNGAASKDMMIAAAIAAGFKPVDDNEADAIHLLRYVDGVNDVLKNNLK
jgi:hypothetical protein